MTRLNILHKTEQFLYFLLFYATLLLIFYVSILTASHVVITVPLLSIYHALTSEYGVFQSIYLVFSGGISAHEFWSIFLNVTSVVAAVAAATYSIRHLFDSK